MKYFATLLLATSFVLLPAQYSFAQSTKSFTKSALKENDGEQPEWDDPNKQAQYEIMRLRDPKTGLIPPNIHQKELQFASHIPTREQMNASEQFKSGGAHTQAVNWVSRGPYNIGGRTRALGVDVNDTNIILAGGVSGGMWRSTDHGTSWVRTTPLNANPSVTCLVQDTRPGKTNIWYYGSGEFLGNSAGLTSIYFSGEGIFKSTDDGQTWFVLPSTHTDSESYYLPFSYISNIAIDPSNLDEDIIYASTTLGIMRSSNGGLTWENTLKGIGFSDYRTDVAVTSSGIVYATINNRPGGYFFRSTDGITWADISPAGWNNNGNIYFVLKIGIAPSNENVVYFLSDQGYFWRYVYNSGDGSGNGGTWNDRSSNLKYFGSYTGYDLFIRVKPDDDNVVLFGGLALFCTTDGLATSLNYYTIGVPHLDQQTAVFMPSNPQELLLGNDGGVYITTNDTSRDLELSPLNNGYQNAQFYTVAIDHESPGSATLIGGMQDNGTSVTLSTSSTKAWLPINGGDGGFCAIAGYGGTYYISYQYGPVIRYKINGIGDIISSSDVEPHATSAFKLFINPYALDPNDSNLMYYVGGPMLWRNNNLANIPPSWQTDSVAFWDSLPGTNNMQNEGITAISVSTIPRNRVYYGTQNGKIFRIDNANVGNPTAENITSKTFSGNSYINCIAIDPNNADSAIVVFSNYYVQSLFLTPDGGKTWMPIGGNLEQYPDGSGNGPSCRWASILHTTNGTVYLVGASTGLYSTTRLNGMSTVWAEEGASTIGSAVVDMMDVRQSDGFVAVATHGNGIFSGYMSSGSSKVNAHIETPADFTLQQNYPNPFSNETNFTFSLPATGSASLKIYNMIGEEVATPASGEFSAGEHTAEWNAGALPHGVYFYRLQSGAFTATKQMVLMK